MSCICSQSSSFSLVISMLCCLHVVINLPRRNAFHCLEFSWALDSANKPLAGAWSPHHHCVGADEGDAHLAPHKTYHLAVLPLPFGSQQGGNPLLVSSCFLTSHTINRINQRNKTPSPFQTSIKILILLLLRSSLQNLRRSCVCVKCNYKLWLCKVYSLKMVIWSIFCQ